MIDSGSSAGEARKVKMAAEKALSVSGYTAASIAVRSLADDGNRHALYLVEATWAQLIERFRPMAVLRQWNAQDIDIAMRALSTSVTLTDPTKDPRFRAARSVAQKLRNGMAEETPARIVLTACCLLHPLHVADALDGAAVGGTPQRPVYDRRLVHYAIGKPNLPMLPYAIHPTIYSALEDTEIAVARAVISSAAEARCRLRGWREHNFNQNEDPA